MTRLIGPPQSRRRRRLFFAVLAAVAAAVIFIPSALAVHDEAFQLDGDPFASTTTTLGGHTQNYDWDSFFGNGGTNPTNGSIASKGVLPTGGFSSGVGIPDFKTGTKGGKTVFDTSDDSTFTVASKDINNVSGWTCTPANNVTDKGDIINAYAVTYTDPSGDQFLYFGLERSANTGDANVGFWFLQGGASCPSTGGSFVGDHHDGDIFVVSAFTKGGNVSTITAYRWTGGAGGGIDPTPVATGADCTAGGQPLGDSTCATANKAAITSGFPWLTYNKTYDLGNKVDTGEFFEGGLNLTDTNLDDECFNTFLANTRSSQELTATLYDYALGTLGECHSTTVTTPSSTSDGNTPIDPNGISVGTGNSGVDVYDKAVVTAFGVPTLGGNVTWHLCGPTPLTDANYTLCTSGGALIGANPKSVGPGSPSTVVSDAAHLTKAGRYCWRADYSGDSATGLPGSSDSSVTECFKVLPVQPDLTTNATAAVAVGNALDDTATLTGTAYRPGTGGTGGGDPSINPTARNTQAQGTITFTLYSPGATHCGTVLGTSVVNVNGDGSNYKASTGTITGTLTPSAPGTYYWIASYSGDPVNTLGKTNSCDGANETSKVVDARIKIEGTKTNEVGQSHTFTVTFEQNDGTGWSAVPDGNKPTVSISPAPGTKTDNCATSGTVNGVCTVVINSSTPGVFTANASGSVTVLGQSMTRDTDSATAGVPCGGGIASCGPAVKTYVDARIKIEGTKTNEVGQSHTFTVTFEQNDGTGWSAVPNGNKPTVSISPAPGTKTDNCATTGTVAGVCTVVINNSTPGVFTANASGSVTVGGVSMTRDTDSATAGVPCGGGQATCGPAVKTYVDARIKIEGTKTNEVGQSHTFTVTFEQNDGTGWSAVPDGNKPTVSISPAPGSKTDNCATSGTVAGVCTVVINNSTPGVFTANASGSVTVGGVAMTRDTDSATASVPCGGGQATCGPAVKTYVDARIKIEGTATNEVGHSHTFTVTFEQNDGTGWSAVPDGNKPTVSISPAPGSKTDNCATSGTVNGVCTVVINNSTPGQFTANASGSVTVGGVAMTRDTDSATAGVPCGGGIASCGPAVKTYVDAYITITPQTAANPVGTDHVLTISVYTNAGLGGGYVLTGGVPVTASLTNSGGATADFDPPGANTCTTSSVADATFGTCTVTIKSPTAGQTKIHASFTNLSVGGVLLSRATGDGISQDSPDATKNWGDANIQITPLNPVNEVKDPETFTVTFTASGTGIPDFLTGTNGITIDVSPTPDITNTNTCDAAQLVIDITGTIATCTVTINNSTPGTFTVTATGKVTVNGIQLTRQTGDNAHGDSPSAVKTYVDSRIKIEGTKTNEVGHDHTFTVTFEQNDGTNGWQPVPDGNKPSVSISPAPGTKTDNCASTGTVNGVCTVVINNSTPGVFTANASGSVSVLGVSMTRDTDSATAGVPCGGGQATCGPAVKTYVDARIKIEGTKTNEVGHDHTFTVTFEQNDGTNGWQPVPDGNKPTVSISPAPGTKTDNCALTGTVAGVCTVVINNSTPGVFTANASGSVTVGGVAMTRDTDSATAGTPCGGGQATCGPAVKTYVDARIKIEGTKTNEVGQSHTFTVTFEQNDGTGWSAVPDGNKPTVSISPAPGTKTDNCALTGTVNGVCTVVINNSTPGVFTANASGSVTVGGVSMTRDTDSATAGVPCGGGQATCGPAVKTYVDARVSITPTATNGITEPHTFTVTVEKNAGSGWVVAPGAHVDVTLTDAGGAAHSSPTGSCTTAGPNTDANGQCTITFTSNSAGTVTGHATASVTVGGLTLTRETDGLNGNSGNAVKTFVQGSLKWIKRDGGGNLLGGATFQVCATAGTAASVGHTPLCVTVVDNTGQLGYSGADSDPVAGQFELDKYQSFGGTALGGLALGTYTITETVAPAGFQLDPFVDTEVIDQAHLNVTASHTFVDTQPGQGCTPGFWKNHQSAWNGPTVNPTDKTIIALEKVLTPNVTTTFAYSTAISNFNNQLFGQVFWLSGTNLRGLSSTLTLLGALNLGGGGFQALARHGTAGLLSSGSVQYPYSPLQVLQGVHDAFVHNNANYTGNPDFPDGVLTDLTNANNLDESACPSS